MQLTCLRRPIRDPEYVRTVRALLSHDHVLMMKDFVQHGRTSTLEHCVNVSYICWRIAKRLRLDARALARAALLHDMYLYDWHEIIPEHIDKLGKHAFYHPKVACHNAMAVFHLNRKERDIIMKHMWPVTPIPPRYRETWVIVFVDKYCAFMEFLLEVRIRCHKRLRRWRGRLK
ncbi:MAG: HD domain-containing protein [Eubacteriales bacterium]|nr:HD domain-containing protein [Eubacteriales bacterium]